MAETTTKQWRVRDVGMSDVDIFDDHDCYVCEVLDRGKAAHIVRCVNSHAALVEACRAALERIDAGFARFASLDGDRDLSSKLTAAIAGVE